MVLTTLPRAAPRRVPATPRKEAATAALRVARTLAMTWAALRLSPRLPLINRPPLPRESPAQPARNSWLGGCGRTAQPGRAYARHLVQRVRSRHFAADRGPAGARRAERWAVPGPQPLRSYPGSPAGPVPSGPRT